MNSLYREEIIKLLLLLSLGYLVGSQLDNVWIGLVMALVFYVGMMLRNYRRFNTWLNGGGLAKKPLVNNFWSTIIDQIQRLVNQLRSEQQLLLDDVEYFKESFQALDDGVVIVDDRGRIDWCNKAALRLLGIDLDSDKGQLMANLVRAPEFIHYLEARDYQQALAIASPRSASLHLEIQATLFRQNYTLLFVRNISEVYSLEKMRQDFIANVSHELRTPLTVITGYLETLQDNVDDLPGVWTRAIEQMLSQSHRMDTMVEDLIWLSRLESVPTSESQTVAVAIENLLAGIVSEANVPFSDKSIVLEIRNETFEQHAQLHWPLQLQGNHEELRSAFSNLVQNAIKYTPETGVITVSCWCDRDSLKIEVEDDGEGIDAVHIPRLTERFYRVDSSRTSATGGTGLGLAIVKHVLARHDASLSISSEPGVGSRFTCTFPLQRLVLKS